MLPIAAAALASTAAIPAVAAQASELASLIEAHRAAAETFSASITALENADWAFREQEKGRDPDAIPCFGSTIPYTGGIVSFETCRNHIENTYEFFCGAVGRMRSYDPAKAGEMLAQNKISQDEALIALDAAVKEYEQRKATAGVTSLEEARDAASEADTQALYALCSCECHTLADVRLKASYLLKYYDGFNLDEQDLTALLQSLAGGANV
jgi:hypothetical protein